MNEKFRNRYESTSNNIETFRIKKIMHLNNALNILLIEKQSYKFKIETIVFRKIRRYQKSTNFLISKITFQLICQKKIFNVTRFKFFKKMKYQIQRFVFETLQKVIEVFLLHFTKVNALLLKITHYTMKSIKIHKLQFNRYSCQTSYDTKKKYEIRSCFYETL